jgi:alanyl-tRNA synthetase
MDLTADIARERELTVDEAGFEIEMNKQRERARSASHFELDYNTLIKLDTDTHFTGYDGTAGQGAVVALLRGAEQMQVLQEGEEGVVVLDRTPFYAESGGQTGDAGYLESRTVRMDVHDTSKVGGAFLHHVIVLDGTVKIGDVLNAQVAEDIRRATANNHSATHLLHAALRTVLGTHVQQKGSLVDSERLRFDFTQPEAIGADRLRDIEQLVNDEIRRNTVIETTVGDMDVAKEKGAMMLFGEKYGDSVRILSMGSGFSNTMNGSDCFSVELCGGTHANQTGDIGLFRIVSESGIAAGIRRIEAVTGKMALMRFDQLESELHQACALLKTNRAGFVDKLQALTESSKQLEKQLAQLKTKLASGAGGDLSTQAIVVNGVTVLAAQIDGADTNALRTILDQMKDKLKSAVILLATTEAEKVVLIAGVTADLTGRFKAGDIIRDLAPLVGGKGGGRADMAQGGGTDVSGINAALAALQEWVSVK